MIINTVKPTYQKKKPFAVPICPQEIPYGMPWDVDLIAYIRFASVYRKFGDIDAFMKELKKLKKEHIKKQKNKKNL